MVAAERAVFPVGAGHAAGGLELRCVIFAHHKDRLVLIRHHRDPVYGDAWTLPGGTLRYGVHPRQCAAMMLKDQAGVTAKSIRLLGVRSSMDGDWILTFQFEAEIDETAPPAKGAHESRMEPIDAEAPPDLHPHARADLEMFKVLRHAKQPPATPP